MDLQGQEDKIMAKTITIDFDECIGCEACVELCPEVFEFDEGESKAFVREDADANSDCIDEAVASCPSECIIVE